MSQPFRGGLGRGLSALLPKDVRPDGPMLRELGIDEIRPNPRQPRVQINPEQLAELTASIRSVGLLQPVVVRPAGDDEYELIAGERRWRACMAAGLERIPAIVRDTDDDAMLRDALIENLQRVDLDPLEEAAAYRQLVDDFGTTHEEIAARVGKSRVAVTNALRLLNTAPEVQERLQNGSITAAHARALAAIADHATQGRLVQRVVAEGLSAKQTEDLVRQLALAGEARLGARAIARREASQRERPAALLEVESLLSDILATKVSVQGGRARGKIVIEYAGEEDLGRILRTIGTAHQI